MSQNKVLILLALASYFPDSKSQNLISIGTSLSGSEFYITTGNHSWFNANWWCNAYGSSVNATGELFLASIETPEDRQLLFDYFEPIYGSNYGELVWTAGTTLGSLRPYDTRGLHWADESTAWIGPWCCRTEPSITPNTYMSLRVCVAGSYREGPGANPPFEFLHTMHTCTDSLQALCKTRMNIATSPPPT